MIAMGVITVVLAVQGPGMAPDGWQVELAAALGHWAAVIQQFLSFIPGWISTLAVFAALGCLVWIALRSRRPTATDVEARSCDSCDDEQNNASTPSPTPAAAAGNRPDHVHERTQKEESQ